MQCSAVIDLRHSVTVVNSWFNVFFMMIHVRFYDFHSEDVNVIRRYDVAKQLPCLQVYVASFSLFFFIILSIYSTVVIIILPN